MFPGYTKAGQGKRGELTPTSSLSYETMNNQVKETFKNIQDAIVNFKKTVHLPKGVSLRHFEEEGVSDA